MMYHRADVCPWQKVNKNGRAEKLLQTGTIAARKIGFPPRIQINIQQWPRPWGDEISAFSLMKQGFMPPHLYL